MVLLSSLGNDRILIYICIYRERRPIMEVPHLASYHLMYFSIYLSIYL